MAQVAVAYPISEFDAVGYRITQTPTEVDNSKLWALRQAARTAGVVLLVVGDPSPDPGGPPTGYVTTGDVQSMITAALATFALSYPSLADALRVTL